MYELYKEFGLTYEGMKVMMKIKETQINLKIFFTNVISTSFSGIKAVCHPGVKPDGVIPQHAVFCSPSLFFFLFLQFI